MNKVSYIGLAIVATLSAASCSQSLLDIPQKGVVAIENFYQTPEDCQSAVTAAYNQWNRYMTTGSGQPVWCIAPPHYVITTAPSDECYYGSGNPGDHVFGLEINEYRPSLTGQNTIVVNNYISTYQLIYTANQVIDHFSLDDSNANVQRNVAEAMVIRAWAHLHLAIYWGNAPYVDHVLSGDDRPGHTPKEEILKNVISDLSKAANYLPSRQGKGDKNGAVRLTKEAALSFLGKAQVHAGDFAGAKETLKKVIGSNNYALVPGDQMLNLFHKAGDANEEKIFELNFVDNSNAGLRSTATYHWQVANSCFWRDLKILPDLTIQEMGWGGGGNPTQKFVNAILENEGNSARRKAWIISYEELLTELSYTKKVANDANMTKEEKLMDPSRGITPEANTAGGYYGNCGWFLLKFAPFFSDLINNSPRDTDQNHPVMRYAEVLLLYAEACAMTNDNDGLQYLNEIQRRAGAPETALTMENVKKEKWFELYMEGTRFEDLVRWGDAATELKDNGREVPSFKDDFYLTPGNPHKAVVNYDNAYYNGDLCGWKSNHHEVMPFPFQELNMNPNLHQNPGY